MAYCNNTADVRSQEDTETEIPQQRATEDFILIKNEFSVLL